MNNKMDFLEKSVFEKVAHQIQNVIFKQYFFMRQSEIKDFDKAYNSSDEYRREELIKRIEHALSNLTLDELEALHYDMITKNYINETSL